MGRPGGHFTCMDPAEHPGLNKSYRSTGSLPEAEGQMHGRVCAQGAEAGGTAGAFQGLTNILTHCTLTRMQRQNWTESRPDEACTHPWTTKCDTPAPPIGIAQDAAPPQGQACRTLPLATALKPHSRSDIPRPGSINNYCFLGCPPPLRTTERDGQDVAQPHTGVHILSAVQLPQPCIPHQDPQGLFFPREKLSNAQKIV